jgi:hypothetical protein
VKVGLENGREYMIGNCEDRPRLDKAAARLGKEGEAGLGIKNF